MPSFDDIKVIITTEDGKYIEGDATVDFEVFCATCGAGICRQSEGRLSKNRKFPQVNVEVCNICIRKKDEQIERRDDIIDKLEDQIEYLKQKIEELSNGF